jgi:hypothetical protein
MDLLARPEVPVILSEEGRAGVSEGPQDAKILVSEGGQTIRFPANSPATAFARKFLVG